MLPVDSLALPFKAIYLQHYNALKRIMALKTLAQQGNSQLAQQVQMVKDSIKSDYEKRNSLYNSIDKIITQLNQFKQEDTTKILSKVGSTPLHQSEQSSLVQSDALIQLSQDVSIAEYVARKKGDEKQCAELEKKIGINYYSVYHPMHDAIEQIKKESKYKKAAFLLKSLKTYTDNTDLNTQIDQLLEKIAKAEKLNPKTQSIDFKKAVSEITNSLQTIYCNSLCICPKFPEKMIQYGFKCLKTQFCIDGKSAFSPIQFGTLKLQCPCCLYKKTKYQNTQLKTNIRCAKDKKYLDISNQKIYFIPSQGFVNEKYAKEPTAKRVILQ